MNLEQINQQYEKLCSQIGDSYYKIKQHQELIEDLNKKIDHLNELAAFIKEQNLKKQYELSQQKKLLKSEESKES